MKAWTDSELAAAVDGYLYLLQLEISGIPFSITAHSEILLNGILSERNGASLRYRMRNISSVLEDREIIRLKAFTPANQVGKNVRARLNVILDQRAKTLTAIRQPQKTKKIESTKEDLLRDLKVLKDKLTTFSDKNKVGIGHNNPPDADNLVSEISELNTMIVDVQNEISLDKVDSNLRSRLLEMFIEFGMKFCVWSGQRITDFVKAAAVASGTALGVSNTELGVDLLNMIRSIFSIFF